MAASFTETSPIFLILSLMLFFLSPCHADPDSLQDFCVADLGSKLQVNGYTCKPASAVTADDFFFDGLAKVANISSTPFGVGVIFGTVTSFPGLNTLGLSLNRVDYAPGGVVIPHTHPRATELVLVLKGRVLAAFVSTSNVLYSKVLKPGEIFVIPMGLIHYQRNVGKGKATAVAAFNSQDGGAALLSPALFGSKPSIPSEILAKAFRIDEKLVNNIKSKFGG